MKNAFILTLFVAFAALGVGLAVWLGNSQTQEATRSVCAAPTTPDAPAQLSFSEPEPECRQLPPPPKPCLPQSPRPDSDPADIRPVAYVAEADTPKVDDERVRKAYEFLRKQLGADAVPGTAGTAVQTPAGEPKKAEAPAAVPRGESLGAPTLRVVPAPAGAQRKARIDREGDGSLSIHIQNADLRDVLDLLGEQGGLNILCGTSVQGKVSATLNGVDLDSALQAILRSTGFVTKRDGRFLFVGTPEEFASMERSLDRVQTRVYRPNYVTSAELQKLIQPILTEKVGVVTVSTPSEAGIVNDATQAGGNNFAGGDVVVVRDYAAVLAMVDQVVTEVDVRPAQVHIEAMILSVKLKDSDRYGVNFQFLRDQPNVKLGIGAPEATLANMKFEQGALKFGFLDSSLGTFLEALEMIGDTNVIATPRLMVLNKHRAEIQIGEQKGYISTTFTETASTQSVQFLDVGALLRLRPFISSDGLIRMEVHPELSDGQVKTENGFTLPEKQVTQVTTNIMVRDGCTVVIGGLMRENLATNTSQVPLLGNLPIVGIAFRTSTETTERHEVLVLITPHIVYEPGTAREGDKAAAEFHRRQSVYADKMTPLNKRSLGRRYFRLAQGAWAEGNRDRALRFAELSVHFDPENRAAIDLRADIWQGKQAGDHTLTPPMAVEAGGNPIDDPATVEGLLDGTLDVSHPAARGALHPLDPGQPGRMRDVKKPERMQ